MDATTLRKLKLKALLVYVAAFVFIEGALAATAGTFAYWQGWLFCAVTFVWAFCIMVYFFKTNPEFLQRRMRYKEKEVAQKNIVRVSGILFFLGFLIPGLDFRFGWSEVPVWLVIAAEAVIFLGYFVIFSAFKENPYAARTVEVFKGQTIVSTGPYSIVRHPMYAGVIPMYLAMPVALGSYWAIPPFLVTCLVIIFRTLNEEAVLKRDLPGYKEYCKKVRYRLIPFVW